MGRCRLGRVLRAQRKIKRIRKGAVMSHIVNDQLIEKCYDETLEMTVNDFSNKLADLGYTYVLNDLIRKVAAQKYYDLPEGDYQND